MSLEIVNTGSQLMAAPNAEQQIAENNPLIEGYFLLQEERSKSDFYAPEDGFVRQKTVEEYEGGRIFSGTYISHRAMHEIKVYKGIDDKPAPTVVMATPLFTGIHGHNDKVAKEIAATGCAVILKGVPRYPKLQRALSLTQDVNEIHCLLNSLSDEANLKVGTLEKIYTYGESQGAMKELGVAALAGAYDRQVIDGLTVAPCFLQRANFRNPRKFMRYGTSMAKSVVGAARGFDKKDISALRGTLEMRDMHHHLAVLPVLTSGEAGDFLPPMDRDQHLTNILFGSDRSSRAHRAQQLFTRNFPNMVTVLYEGYGHVDGIMSQETKSHRQFLFKAAVRKALASDVA